MLSATKFLYIQHEARWSEQNRDFAGPWNFTALCKLKAGHHTALLKWPWVQVNYCSFRVWVVWLKTKLSSINFLTISFGLNLWLLSGSYLVHNQIIATDWWIWTSAHWLAESVSASSSNLDGLWGGWWMIIIIVFGSYYSRVQWTLKLLLPVLVTLTM